MSREKTKATYSAFGEFAGGEIRAQTAAGDLLTAANLAPAALGAAAPPTLRQSSGA